MAKIRFGGGVAVRRPGYWDPRRDLNEKIWQDWNYESLPDGPVASWTDSAGGVVATQATAANQPIKTSDAVTLPTGGQKNLSFATQQGGFERSNRAVVMMYKLNGAASPDTQCALFYVNGIGSSTDHRMPAIAYNRTAHTMIVWWSNHPTLGGSVTVPAGADNVWHVVISRRVNGRAYLSIDGGAEVASDNQNIVLRRLSTNGLGGIGDTHTNSIDWALKRVMLLQGELSDDEVERLAGWAMWKMGVQANLPVDHPYRSSRPLSRPWVNQYKGCTLADWTDSITPEWESSDKTAHVGELIAPLISGYTEVYRDEFESDPVSDDDSGTGPWFAPVQDDVGSSVTVIKPAASPTIWSQAGSAIKLTMQKVGAVWYSSNMVSVNRDGRGLTWNPAEHDTYFEARIRVDADGEPVWPAMWLKDVQEFFYRTIPRLELDVYEGYYGDNDGHHQNVHGWPAFRLYRDRLAAHKNEGNYTNLSGTWPDGTINLFDDEYHTYGMLITKQRIIWTFDGRELVRVQSRPEMFRPFYMLLSLVRWEPSATTGTPEMEIDWVRVLQNL